MSEYMVVSVKYFFVAYSSQQQFVSNSCILLQKIFYHKAPGFFEKMMFFIFIKLK